MDAIMDILEKTVPIAEFNSGKADKIFEEVRENGAKVVIKNNRPECVLMSPEEYISLIEELENTADVKLTYKRLSDYNPKDTISQESFEEKYGIDFNSISPIDESEIDY